MQNNYVSDEDKLRFLLNKNIVFVNYRNYMCPIENKEQESTIVVFMNCSDTFAWGCSDAESISTPEELDQLYKYSQSNHIWGPIQWVIEKRKVKPMSQMQNRLKTLGFWKKEYDSL